jgi:hypothetical protein
MSAFGKRACGFGGTEMQEQEQEVRSWPPRLASIEGIGAGEGEEMERAGELAAKRRRKEELL